MILRVLCGLLFVTIAHHNLHSQAQPGTVWQVDREPKDLVNGSAALFRVTAPSNVEALDGTWFGRKLTFRFAESCHCWFGIGGVDLDTKPGKYALQLHARTGNGSSAVSTYDIAVVQKQYPSTEVNGIPGKYVEPPPEVTARIAEESAFKKQVFARIEPESFWSGQFEPPVASRITAVFGSARVVNKTHKTVHQGMDFRAAVGTPVHAVNNGTIVLARNLYFEGNCVMIDHGDGLLTIYMHMSEFKVKEGESVKTGQLLGLSGNTGRVNGPHVHFAARWQGIYLDPETLLDLRPPAQ